MKKPGRDQLVALCKEATRETGMRFWVQQEARGTYKGTPRYVYAIARDAGQVTTMSHPAEVAHQFRALLDRFYAARIPE